MRGFKTILFAASALFCLLLPNAQATVFHPPPPPGAFFIFNFPGYSSLHDCNLFQDNDSPLSAKACIDSLLEDKKLAEIDDEFKKSDYFRNFIGEFGPNPLIYSSIKMLFCENDCHELKPQRIGPPEMMWQPPEITNKKTYLVFPLRASVQQTSLRLSLSLADGEWRSNLFAGDFWYHNYMNVRFDQANHALSIEHDWKKTLADSANYLALWHKMETPLQIWLILFLFTLPGLFIAKWRFRWRWVQSGRMALWHAIMLTVFLILALLDLSGVASAPILASSLFYIGSIWPEWWLVQRDKELKNTHIFTAQILMRLPFMLLLGMLFFYSYV